MDIKARVATLLQILIWNYTIKVVQGSLEASFIAFLLKSRKFELIDFRNLGPKLPYLDSQVQQAIFSQMLTEKYALKVV